MRYYMDKNVYIDMFNLLLSDECNLVVAVYFSNCVYATNFTCQLL